MIRKYISWRRVSTFKQNKSGLGLSAQKEIIRYFIERDGGDWIADYEECYTGKELSGCVELHKAMEHAKSTGSILIIAKSDRFRNTAEALKIYEEMGEGNIMFCDLPSTDKFTLTLFFALAEREALIVSIRTKQALAVKKSQGCKLGAANETYRVNYANKDLKEKIILHMKHGVTKRKRYMESRDTTAFIKVLQRVFPNACTSDGNIDFNQINTQRENRIAMLSLMRDYKSLDNDGVLFVKWDLDGDLESKELHHKLANLITSVKRSMNNVNVG